MVHRTAIRFHRVGQGVKQRVGPARRACARAALALLMVTLVPAAAYAEDDSAADVAAARSLAVDGVKLAQSGHCDDAIDKLERAEKLHHSAIVLEHLGECYVTQGRLVDGTEALRKVLREPVPSDASATLKKAYEHAQTVLDAAKPKIAALTISVNVGADAHPTVTVDGEAVPPALIGADRPTDPGDHVVEATAAGYLKASSHVSVGPGEKQSVSLELDVDPEAAKAAAAAQEAAQAPPPSGPTPGNESPATSSVLDSSQTGAPPSPPNHVAAYVSWGIGAAAIGVGTVFGILAMNGKSKLDSQCTGNTCPPDASDRLDSSKRDGNIATIGFGVGAVGAVLGTVLFFTVGQGSHGGADSASSKSAPGTFSVGSRGTNFALQF